MAPETLKGNPIFFSGNASEPTIQRFSQIDCCIFSFTSTEKTDLYSFAVFMWEVFA